MGTLEDRLEQDVESWRPDPGDSVTGTIVSVGSWQGDYDPYPVIEFKKDDGTYWSWHAFHTVARNEIARQEPAPGDRFGCKYYGPTKTKPGSKFDSYEKWRVIIEKPIEKAPTPDWESLKSDEASDTDGQVPEDIAF